MVTAQKRDAVRQGQFYFRKTLKKCKINKKNYDKKKTTPPNITKKRNNIAKSSISFGRDK